MTDDLEDFFEAARRNAGPSSSHLAERVMADALDVQSGFAHEGHDPDIQRPSGLWDILGGWRSFGTAAAACCAGAWIGFAPPALVEDLTAQMMGNTVNVSFQSDWTELLSEDQDNG